MPTAAALTLKAPPLLSDAAVLLSGSNVPTGAADPSLIYIQVKEPADGGQSSRCYGARSTTGPSYQGSQQEEDSDGANVGNNNATLVFFPIYIYFLITISCNTSLFLLPALRSKSISLPSFLGRP